MTCGVALHRFPSHAAFCCSNSNLALAQMAFEDAYLTIQDVDGIEWANKLRKKMNSGVEKARVQVLANERTWLKSST